MIEIGAHIPEFEVPATLRGRVGLKGLLGKPFVIYFYPKDATPGCTTETKDFMGLYPEFQKEGVEVLGFNHNPMKAHEKWSQKLQIPFPLLSDEGLELSRPLGFGKKRNSWAASSWESCAPPIL